MKTRNSSIDIFRLVSALFVVWCHAGVFIELDEKIYMAVTQQLPRFSVAYFFGIAGYYYIAALLKGKASLVKQVKAILRVYITWTLIYYVVSFGVNIVLEGGDLATFLVERVVNFFTIGSYFHLWYVVALIYALIIVTIVHKLAGERGIQVLAGLGIVLMILGAFGSVYYPFGSNIPVLNLVYDSEYYDVILKWFGMGLPYVSLGYIVVKLNALEKVVTNKKIWIGWGITFAIYLLEIWFVVWKAAYYDRCELMISVYFLTIMNLLVLLRNPLPQYQKLANASRGISSFVYFSHPLVILVLQKGLELANMSIGSLSLYFAVILITMVLGYIIESKEWCIKKYLL